MGPVGVRLQALSLIDQVLSLARLVESRSISRCFSVSDVNSLFDELALPKPARTDNQFRSLESQGLLTRVKSSKGQPPWRVTPAGRHQAEGLASDMDLAALLAEAEGPLTTLAGTSHPMVPPSLGPPELIRPLHSFLESHPFETNVFGMTRFPGTTEDGQLDPIAPALEATREACALHGLEFHLASDRKIVDELWPNVAAHLWASKNAIAFYEDRTDVGLNYNLNIEVGSCLVLGRRLAILKDKPIDRLPSDLVGRIYHEVDLSKVSTVKAALHRWIRDDLELGPCPSCP
jgi:hypothetical protein